MSVHLATADEIKIQHRWKKTPWRPVPGMDARLRQFDCHDCGRRIYRHIGDKAFAKEHRP